MIGKKVKFYQRASIYYEGEILDKVLVRDELINNTNPLALTMYLIHVTSDGQNYIDVIEPYRIKEILTNPL